MRFLKVGVNANLDGSIAFCSLECTLLGKALFERFRLSAGLSTPKDTRTLEELSAR